MSLRATKVKRSLKHSKAKDEVNSGMFKDEGNPVERASNTEELTAAKQIAVLKRGREGMKIIVLEGRAVLIPCDMQFGGLGSCE